MSRKVFKFLEHPSTHSTHPSHPSHSTTRRSLLLRCLSLASFSDVGGVHQQSHTLWFQGEMQHQQHPQVPSSQLSTDPQSPSQSYPQTPPSEHHIPLKT